MSSSVYKWATSIIEDAEGERNRKFDVSELSAIALVALQRADAHTQELAKRYEMLKQTFTEVEELET